MKALFKLGQVVSTPGAISAMQEIGIEPITLLGRHQSGDWEEMDSEDQLENWYSIDNLQRVLSAYIYEGRKLWVITEADRSLTTILLPEEY